MLVPEILRYIAFGVGLVIAFIGIFLLILAESAPERMIDFLETLALALLGRRPQRRRRTYTARPQAPMQVQAPAQVSASESTEIVGHEHHELVAPTRRKRRIPWRLVAGILVPLLTGLMGYPLVHQGSSNIDTRCAPTGNSEVLLRARHVDGNPPKGREDRPCTVAASDGWCGLLERHAPFLQPILVALHVCPEQTAGVVTTVHVRPARHERGDHGNAANANPARVMLVSRAELVR